MIKHGEINTKLYRVWVHMRERCRCPNTKNYERYGGRGISVCDDWENSFICFRDWALSHGYKDGLTLDRIDNDCNYEPSNCRFVGYDIQNNNFSRNKKVTYNGKTLSLSQWSRLTGIHRNTLDYRFRMGWNPENMFNDAPSNSRTKEQLQHISRSSL